MPTSLGGGIGWKVPVEEEDTFDVMLNKWRQEIGEYFDIQDTINGTR